MEGTTPPNEPSDRPVASFQSPVSLMRERSPKSQPEARTLVGLVAGKVSIEIREIDHLDPAIIPPHGQMRRAVREGHARCADPAARDGRQRGPGDHTPKRDAP